MEHSPTISSLPTNKLLRLMVSPSTDPGTRDAARVSLSATLSNPVEILNSETIPEQHEYKTQARIVLDAFETCTNGIHDPECVKELSSVSDSGFWGPWKAAIYALKAFYDGDTAMAMGAASRVPPGAAPFAVAREINALLLDREKGSSSGNLSGRIFPHDGSLEELIEEFEESCKERAETAFIRCTTRILKELFPRSRKAALRFASMALTRADCLDLVPDDLFHVLSRVLGDSDAARIAARYFQESRPDLSFLFWVKSAVQAVALSSLDALNCSVRLLACALAAEAASGAQEGNDPEIVKSSFVLCRELTETVRVTFGLKGGQHPENGDSLLSCASSLGALALSLSLIAGARDTVSGRRKGRGAVKKAVRGEFDLFGPEDKPENSSSETSRFRDLLESGPEKSLLKGLSDIDPPADTKDLLEGLPRKARYVGPEPWLALIRERAAANRSQAVKG